jgi:hypothetical protein
MDRKEYCFGGKNYEQLPIVLGQLRILEPIISSLKFSPGENAVADLVASLGSNLHRVMAILLVEKGVSVREAMQNIDIRQSDLEWSMFPADCIEVLEDFFECSRISSLFERIREAVQKAQNQAMTTSSSEPSFVSPVEISPGETASNG